ncbi:MAG: FAD-binding oxidoreductase [Nitrospiraceae bacterium]
MEAITAEVVAVRDLTHDVRELDLQLRTPPQLAFQPGQFISFEIPVEGKPHPATRAYSIASPPSQADRLTLLFNRVAHGPGTQFLFGLARGTVVQCKGAAGSFRLRDDGGKALLFVATGTGIAPLRSMILAKLAATPDAQVRLLWGLRSQRDLYYQDELAALATRHPNFFYTVALSKPEAGWTGANGRVTTLVRERVTSVTNLVVYLCGHGDMIRDVTATVHALGLCPIYREKWYDEPVARPTGAPAD